MKFGALSALFVFTAFLIGACTFNAPSGPSFKALPNPTGQQSLVYVYRPATEKFGYDRTYYLFDGNSKLTDLLHGGYFAFYVTPGTVNLLADVNRNFRTWVGGGLVETLIQEGAATLKFQARAGKTYYVEFHPTARAASFKLGLTLIPEQEALNQLASSRALAQSPQ